MEEFNDLTLNRLTMLVVGKPTELQQKLIEFIQEGGGRIVYDTSHKGFMGHNIDWTIYDELHNLDSTCNIDYSWYRKFEKRRKV